jgi:hypothetical protein
MVKTSYKTFKQYFKEDNVQSLFIDIDPNTDENQIQGATRELMGFIRYRSEQGQMVSVVARAISNYPLLNNKK